MAWLKFLTDQIRVLLPFKMAELKSPVSANGRTTSSTFFPFLSQKSSIVSAEEEMPVNGFNEQWNGPAYALYISVNLLAFSCRILMQKWPNSGWFGELYVRHNGSFFVFDCTLSYSWSYSVSGGQFWHRQTHWRIFYIIVWFLCNNRRCPRPRGGDSWWQKRF